MELLKFYLRKTKSKSLSTIQAVLYYEGYRSKLSTGIRIPVKYWNTKKQRSKVLLEFPEGEQINDQLDKMQEVMNSLIKKYRDLGYYPKPEILRKEYLSLNDNPIKNKKDKTFWDYFEEFIEYKNKELNDIRDYTNSLRKHLTNIEKSLGRPLQFELIASPESDFAEDWNRYLLYEAVNSEGNPGLAANTAGKQNKNLKVFLNWCFDRNIITRFSLKKFPTIQEDVDKVYVTEKELEKIYKLDLHDEHEKTVRDLFIIGCETGLRFSDFIRIDSDDIRNSQIHFRPKKTKKHGNKVIIPISERLDSVLSKYNYSPPSFNNKQVTQFNSTLREICKKAKINAEIIRYRQIAGKEIKEIKYKYQEISSHTCRRTFCTLKFLKGMPAQAIMKFSGHKSERNFLKYLKLDAELTANKYEAYF